MISTENRGIFLLRLYGFFGKRCSVSLERDRRSRSISLDRHCLAWDTWATKDLSRLAAKLHPVFLESICYHFISVPSRTKGNNCVTIRMGRRMFVRFSPIRLHSDRSVGCIPVAMATSDKHCQTFPVNKSTTIFNEGSNVMYDETVPVPNAREIESPVSSDGEGVLRAAMAKFNPPVRHTAKHDFDSESETDSGEDFLNNMIEDQSLDRKSMTTTTSAKAVEDKTKELQRQPSEGRESMKTKPVMKRSDTSNSETDSGTPEDSPARPPASSGRRRVVGVVIPAEGAYDPKQYQDLKVPSDIENLFQYIMKYTPQKIDIDFKLHPFVPEYVPAVGDIDAFLKVTPPACNVRAAPLSERVLQHIDNQGLTVLDEPVAEQSDSALLHLQLRAISKISSAKSTVLTKKVENAEKNPKAIDRWIKDVSELHLSKPAPTVTYTGKMPDIDSLMEEWPETMEEALNEVGFPSPSLDCSLSQYVEIVCAMFDIPIPGATLNDRIQALHLLFSLYSAVSHQQHFVDQKENVS